MNWIVQWALRQWSQLAEGWRTMMWKYAVRGFEPMTYGSECECATHYTTAPHWRSWRQLTIPTPRGLQYILISYVLISSKLIDVYRSFILEPSTLTHHDLSYISHARIRTYFANTSVKPSFVSSCLLVCTTWLQPLYTFKVNLHACKKAICGWVWSCGVI